MIEDNSEREMKLTESSGILRMKGIPELDRRDSSVTLLSTETLPIYSCERYYMLSEIEEHGHSTRFLCDFLTDESTQETEELSTESDPTCLHNSPDIPRFVILYLLWKYDMTDDPSVFSEMNIFDAIKKLANVADLVHSMDIPNNKIRHLAQDESEHVSLEHSQRQASVYLVIDRLFPPKKQPWWSKGKEKEVIQQIHHVQEELASRLAKHVASHEILRDLCEGITIGVSNHERAAPGLEACMDAISFGSRDRRKIPKDKKSRIGLISDQPEALLGIQETPDAAEGVLQTKVCAEWNGLGNLQSFAQRAHALWRINNGLPPELEPSTKRRVPRIQKSLFDIDESSADKAMKEAILDTIGFALLALWLMFHFRKEIFGLLDPERLDFIVQHLRQL